MQCRVKKVLILIGLTAVTLTLGVERVYAAVTPAGVAVFSEIAADDNQQFLNYVSPSTYTDRGNSVDTTTNTNDITHNVIVTCPTRDEMMSGQIETNGTLHVTKCIGGCDASGDWSEELEEASATTTQTCDITAGACNQAFDIAYEQLSGDAVVAYGDTGDDGKIHYNVWNGTSWEGEATYTFNSGSVVNTLWVRLVPHGSQLTVKRTNKLLLVVEDDNNDIFAAIWDGSSFGNLTTITLTAAADTRLAFDGAWETLTEHALVVWGEGTTSVVNPFRFKVFDGSSWGSVKRDPGNIFTAVSTGAWVRLRSDPQSDRIAAGPVNAASDFRPAMWKANGSDEEWTFGTEVADLEGILANQTAVAWEKYNNGIPFAIFIKSQTGTTDLSDYETWTSGSGFSGYTDMPGAAGDDTAAWKLYGAPNTDEMLALNVEFAEDLCFQRWSGIAWDADCTTTEYSTSLVPDTGTAAHNESNSFDFAYRAYYPWSRNWRLYDDETSNSPSVGLNGASENQAPAEVDKEEYIRLRVQMRELGAVLNQTDTRYKVQYTSGCNPNTNENACTWVDVGDTSETSSVWRYATSAETCASCSDNTAVSTARLTGTTQNGAYISDKDAAGGSNMDHNASAIVEYDYPLKAEDVGGGITYYFRLYDLGSSTAVYRRQDTGTTDCLGSTCTYPSLTTAAVAEYTQNDFEWFVTAGSTTLINGWPLGLGENLLENEMLSQIPATNETLKSSDKIRLQMNFIVEGATLSAGSQAFKLQYDAAEDCTSASGWADVGSKSSGSIWRLFDEALVADSTPQVNDISTSSVSAEGLYLEINDGQAPNPNEILDTENSEWDWPVENNGAVENTTYCFRMALGNGTALNYYNGDSYPKVTTAPSVLSLMRHGNIFQNNAKRGFFWAD